MDFLGFTVGFWKRDLFEVRNYKNYGILTGATSLSYTNTLPEDTAPQFSFCAPVPILFLPNP